MIRRFLPLMAVTLLAFATPAAAQKNCVKGKPCGNTCIARTKTCHVGTGSATATAAQPSAPSRVRATPPSSRTTPQLPAAKTPPPEGTLWVGLPAVKAYYWHACPAARGMVESHLKSGDAIVYFPSEKDAKKQGYHPTLAPGCGKPEKADAEAPASTLRL